MAIHTFDLGEYPYTVIIRINDELDQLTQYLRSAFNTSQEDINRIIEHAPGPGESTQIRISHFIPVIQIREDLKSPAGVVMIMNEVSDLWKWILKDKDLDAGGSERTSIIDEFMHLFSFTVQQILQAEEAISNMDMETYRNLILIK